MGTRQSAVSAIDFEISAILNSATCPRTEQFAPEVPGEFWKSCLETDPTSGTRTPPSIRAPNGVLEDSFYQANGRPLWNAASIYTPTLVIAGEFDSWSLPEDRKGLMRDLVHAPSKRDVLIPGATHYMLFEKTRFQFFEEVLKFLKE